MKYRNVKRISENEINLDLNHPIYGWIPYTAINNYGEPEMQEIWNSCFKDDLEYDIDIIKNRYLSYINDICDSNIYKLQSKYTKAEIDSWNMKVEEANKVVNGEQSEIIKLEALIRNEDLLSLSNKIIEKNKLYNKTIVSMEAIKKNAKNDFEKEYTYHELQKLYESYVSKTEQIIKSLSEG